MARTVTEWIGKTPDSKIPDRVRLRIFNRFDGRCYLSGREIRPGDAWEIEHRVALILGGEHRESNMAPVLAEFHKQKTAAEMKVKAKTDAIAKKHNGIKKPSSALAKKDRAPKRLTKELPRRVRDVFGRPTFQPKEADAHDH